MTAQSKAILNRKARERMAAHRQTPEYQEWLQRSRELRRQLKAKYRRQAGCKTRDPEERAARLAQQQARREQRAMLAALHDAHVKRFRAVMKARAKAARRYASAPDGERERSAARKRSLPDSYVRELLRGMGIPAEAITPHLIELKREVKLFRHLSRQIHAEILNQAKESSYEGITQHP